MTPLSNLCKRKSKAYETIGEYSKRFVTTQLQYANKVEVVDRVEGTAPYLQRMMMKSALLFRYFHVACHAIRVETKDRF